MNRYYRKKRKMELKRMGLESFRPDKDSFLTISPYLLPKKYAKHFHDGKILCCKMRGYEFTRPLRKELED